MTHHLKRGRQARFFEKNYKSKSGKQANRQAHIKRQTGRQAGLKTGKQAGGRASGGQSGKQACSIRRTGLKSGELASNQADRRDFTLFNPNVQGNLFLVTNPASFSWKSRLLLFLVSNPATISWKSIFRIFLPCTIGAIRYPFILLLIPFLYRLQAMFIASPS